MPAEIRKEAFAQKKYFTMRSVPSENKTGAIDFVCSEIKLKINLADNDKRDLPMIEPIGHTGIAPSPNSYPPIQGNPGARSGFDGRKDMFQPPSKYILEDNKIVFERYDRNGKLILRVPWTAHRVSEMA